MARMFMRAFALSVLALALLVPSASAGPLDKFVPVYDAAHGVTVTRAHGKIVFRFGPKAAKLYRGLAGKKAIVGCGHPVKDDGSYEGGGDSSGFSYSGRAGMYWTDVRVPSK